MPEDRKDESSLGANYRGGGRCDFLVWAPMARKVDLHLLGVHERLLSLERRERGYFQASFHDVFPGDAYLYRLDDAGEYPDPASRYQFQGPGGPSYVSEPAFDWDDRHWIGIPLSDYIIYELHVGTFTREGTFAAVIPHLDELKKLGITAVEIMPVAQFPGGRNWGYDGAYPFAVQNSYGGYSGLKQLINACHRKGLAVVLDVVYNHFGPEGSPCSRFGPYCTDRYKTDWGPALNFDGPQSDEVRRFFIENAVYWIKDFHIDALRLDAVHAILDCSPVPFLEQLAAAVHRQADMLGRRVFVIAESDANDARLVGQPSAGGFGMDAVWNDDYHHALHALLTGERAGYYQDYGQLRDLKKALKEGFVYTGQYSPYRQHSRGSPSADIPSGRLVVFSQNHDQIGNRPQGERMSSLVSGSAARLAAGLVLLSPFIPLIFMGEEYAETAPFLYFISHSNPELAEAVRLGRQRDMAAFQPAAESPDPQDEAAFRRSRLDHSLKETSAHRKHFHFYRELIRLRKSVPALSDLDRQNLEAVSYDKPGVLYLYRRHGESEIAAAFNFAPVRSTVTLPVPGGRWQKLIDSADRRWSGRGSTVPSELKSDGEISLTLSPQSFVLLELGDS